MLLRNCFLLHFLYFLRTWYAIIHCLVFAHEIVPSFHSDVLLFIRVVLIKYFWWIISVTFCALRCRHETNKQKKIYSHLFSKMHFFVLSIHPSSLAAHFQFDMKTQNNRIFECMQAFFATFWLYLFISTFISFTLERLVIL
jgi:hypothetical protein